MSAPTNGNGNGFTQRYSVVIQTVTVAALIVGGFWGAVINPMRAELIDLKKDQLTIREHEEFKNRLDREIAVIRETSRSVVPRSEHEARWAEFDHNIARIDLRNAEGQKLIVPRDELNARLNFIESNTKVLSERVNDLRTSITAPYPVREQIDRLNTEIAEMRRLLYGSRQEKQP